MKFLLDSNAWIGWLRQKQPKLIARIKQESPADMLLCSVVLGELIYQPVEKRHRGVFQRRQARSKAPRGSQNNDLRRHFGITSV